MICKAIRMRAEARAQQDKYEVFHDLNLHEVRAKGRKIGFTM
jgi:hypothetical protein